MDRIFEFGNSVFEAASEKINTINLADTKKFISERAGNVLGYGGSSGGGGVFDIQGKRYQERQKIAEGGFGIVYLVRDDYGQQFALKRMFVQDRERLSAIKNEIDVMLKLKHHKNIVKLESYKINQGRDETEVLMLIEFCSGGSVLDIMNQRGEHSRLSEKEILAIFSDTCLAVMELHNQSIIHRDIKIENILLCENTRCYKLCDFGSSTTKVYDTSIESQRSKAEDDINTFTTLFYRAPEMVDLYRRQVINEKADIWALGCLLFKMAFYVDPFDGGSLSILNNNYQIPENSRYSDRLHQLIRFMLTPDPAQRPSIYDILNRLEEFKSSNVRRSGLQTFSPAKPPQQPQQQLNRSNCGLNGSHNNLSNSNNSTPSFNSSPVSNNSSPSTNRKQNLFDILDGGNSMNSTPNQPKSVSNQNNNNNVIDDFNWSNNSNQFNNNNSNNNNNNNQNNKNNRDFDDDLFNFTSSSTTSQKPPTQPTKNINTQKSDEFDFFASPTVNTTNNNNTNNNNKNQNNNNFGNFTNYNNSNQNGNNTSFGNYNNNHQNNNNQNNNKPQQNNNDFDFDGWSVQTTPALKNSTSSSSMSSSTSSLNSSGNGYNGFTSTNNGLNNSGNNGGFNNFLNNNVGNNNGVKPQQQPQPQQSNFNKPNYNIDFNTINNQPNNGFNNYNGNNNKINNTGNNTNNQFNFDSFAMYAGKSK